MDDAKRCPRCGYLQIIEAFPMYINHGKRRRSAWCQACWRERSAMQRAPLGSHRDGGPKLEAVPQVRQEQG